MDNSNLVKLPNLLEYSNENVIFRFQKLFHTSEEEALDIFTETKKWLYALDLNTKLYKEGEHDFTIGINDDLLIIDEMWHNFILFTKDYNHFCQTYFNRFIDHQPATKAESARDAKIDFEELQKQRKVFYKKQFSFIYDLLGKDTLVKWHKEYPVKYSIEKIKELRK